MVSIHMSHHREVVTAIEAPAAIGPYSHAVRAGGLLVLLRPDPARPVQRRARRSLPGEQARQCLQNLAAVCAAGGAGLADAVQVTVYLTDMGAFAEVNEVYAGFFEADPPARVAIGVAALPKGAQVEVAAVVALPDE